eukprot:TRINITY_DN1816_c0_g1_i1.p1 TRINITY_DN1816_c0_g1~~TRINITY_DN1816_c0_g1_i1.p1  ORF type:complete len:323 (+),score=103.81 TRINITY_DN1816_c0_g1_i1:117-1085(+)
MDGVEDSLRLAGAFWRSLCGHADAAGSSAGINLQSDVVVFAVYAAVTFAFNWLVRLFVVEPLARWVLVPAPSSPRFGNSAAARRSRKQDVEKFSQSAMEAIFYGAFAVMGMIIVPQQDWSWPSSGWWDYDRTNPVWKDDMRCYYILYCARYFQGGVSIFLEHKRKDFWEMFIHHWVTVVLVALSYVHGYYRVGAVVMVLLDPADVPLHVAKIHKYVADARRGTTSAKRYQFAADRWFECFAVMFAITRCMMYPYCCWSAMVESRVYTDLGVAGQVCCVLLDILLVLQYYWMYLIIAAAIRMARNGGIEDVRSDDEDEAKKDK